MKNNKVKWIIGITIIIISIGLAIYSFQSSLNPYVTIAEAAETARQVQVMGYIDDPDSIVFNQESGKLQFVLSDDEGTTVQVIYEGPRPDNLDHADSVVVVGYYRDNVFAAEKLLVKCPSKYEQGGDK